MECNGVLERGVAELFHGLRRKGNLANHDLQGNHATALKIPRVAWQLGVWFHRTFGDPRFRSGPFQPPPAGDPELAEELQRLLRVALAAFQSAEGQVAEQLAHPGATGCSASPAKRRRSRSSIAKPLTTTPCCSAGKAAAGRA